jgi:AbrB family looped-hinge helix DNA binding protein
MNATATTRAENLTSAADTKETLYTTVSTKGQVVIPAAIRHKLGIEPGTRVALHIEGGGVVMIPRKKLTWRDMRGIGAGLPSGTDMLLEDRRLERERELREEGW